MFKGLTTSSKVTDAIDSINESLQNVLNNTAVSNVAFISDMTAGGAGLVATLTITADGNPNRYTINWGDGTTDTAVTDSNPPHTYSTNTGSPDVPSQHLTTVAVVMEVQKHLLKKIL